MKKLLLGSILLALALAAPISAMAEVNISIGFPLPPPVVFPAPPEVIVVPDAYGVYAVPDIDVDIFFWNGWWWRPWEGRWYHSRYYDRGWAYYANVPRFYYDVEPGWRRYYRDHDWRGHRWDHERIPYDRLHKHWKSWDEDRYWEKKKTWGVQGYQHRPEKQREELRHQRQKEYQQRPEVQRYQQERHERQKHKQRGDDYQRKSQKQRTENQQREPGVQQPRNNHQPSYERSEPRGQQHQEKASQQKSHGKSEGGGGKHKEK